MSPENGLNDVKCCHAQVRATVPYSHTLVIKFITLQVFTTHIYNCVYYDTVCDTFSPEI